MGMKYPTITDVAFMLNESIGGHTGGATVYLRAISMRNRTRRWIESLRYHINSHPQDADMLADQIRRLESTPGLPKRKVHVDHLAESTGKHGGRVLYGGIGKETVVTLTSNMRRCPPSIGKIELNPRPLVKDVEISDDPMDDIEDTARQYDHPRYKYTKYYKHIITINPENVIDIVCD